MPDLELLRVFGCTAFVQDLKQLRKNLDDTSDEGVLVWYDSQSKA